MWQRSSATEEGLGPSGINPADLSRGIVVAMPRRRITAA